MSLELVHPGGPSREALIALHAKRLAPDLAVAIQEHAHSCEVCAEALQTLAAISASLEPSVDFVFAQRRTLDAVRERLSTQPETKPRRRLLYSLTAASAVFLVVSSIAYRFHSTDSSVFLEIEPGRAVSEGDALTVEPQKQLAAQWGDTQVILRGDARGARATVASAKSRKRRITLDRGYLALDVTPLPKGASLVVSADDLTVSVKGTRFAVVRGDDGTTVLVHHGLVQVSWPNGAVEVGSGQKLLPNSRLPIAANESDLKPLLAFAQPLSTTGETVSTESTSSVPEPPAPVMELQEDTTAGRDALEESDNSEEEVRIVEDARRAVLQGEYREALRQLATYRRSHGGSDVQAILLEAHALRLLKRPNQALELLRSTRGADTHEAEQVEMVIAQVFSEDLKNPRRAASALQSIIDRFPAGIFAEEARFGLGKALLRSREYRKAASALEQYLLLHPSGVHAKEARGLIAAARRAQGK